ncbi:unnamed protein product [Spirodela intermedia]|uniref:Reticulon-like protein n=1 Tax=Spirodela intermedia TaxID=51605 RepID=A0A7I8LCA8_SPIIN|nr:unnamed protein product [Spirodela intermedia]
MAAAEDRAVERVSPPAPSLQSAGPSSNSIVNGRVRFSVHRALGGGAVANVILWRRRNAPVVLLTGASATWFLFEIAGYSFLSLAANVLLLLVSILFLWARSASLLNRPLPPVPNLEIPDRVAEKIADDASTWINYILAVAREIALEGDRKLFLEVIVFLWIASYIGSFFSFLTFVYLGIILCFTIPAFYDKYQDHIDEKVGLAHHFLLNQYETFLVKTGRSVRKEKKTD